MNITKTVKTRTKNRIEIDNYDILAYLQSKGVIAPEDAMVSVGADPVDVSVNDPVVIYWEEIDESN